MRLDRLDLDRYGRFTGARLDFPPPAPGAPDLHVIFGPNEAGKSTLFSAWLDLLYGIPLRSRYDFLHPGPTLQIGARLSHAGGVLEAVRLKRNGPSLLDATGETLPEAVMQAALAGLGREGYAAMFSLDDDTLEQGGESILASRGDLGEMLFSASAGLAGLGPQLEAVRVGLDAFHRPRAHKTRLKAAKDRLQDLARQRRELDTTVSAAQKLGRDVAAAEAAWALARQVETAASAALKTVEAARAVLPQQARLARLRAELEPLSHLPPAVEADERGLHEIEQAEREIAGRMGTRAVALAELERRAAALRRDPAILPLADRIAEAQGLSPLHLAALADLPRRRDSLAGIEAALARLMQSLGLSGLAADRALSPPRIARLRALVARRDMAALALRQAEDEARKARDRLEMARQAPGDPSPGEDLHALGHLMARLRLADPEAARTRAEQDGALREAELARALLALAPWRGGAEELAALDVPAPWQLAALAAAEDASGRALREAADTRARRLAELSALAPEAAATGGAPSLAEAAEARRRREAAWAAHLGRLAPDTAAAFETALRLDDRITLHLAEAMAAAREEARLRALRARLEAEAAAAEVDWRTRQAERQAQERAVADCAAALGLAGAGVGDLGDWLERRDRALAALQARDQARAALSRAEAALSEAAQALAAALALPVTGGFALLRAEALARLETAERRAEAARRLAEIETEAAARDAALGAATREMAAWRQDWQAASLGSALAEAPEDGAELAARLDQLDELSRLVSERAELADRIAKMEANGQAFRTAAAGVLAALGLAEDTPLATLDDRLAAARQAERDHAQITADLARDHATQEADGTRAGTLAARRAALADRLGWTGARALPDHLADCLRASRLRRDIAELAAELANQPAPEADAVSLDAEAARLQDAHALARAESETRFAALSQARQALQAVGGDDAAARIAAERANLLDELKDQARAHLAQRFALVAFEQGLRRFRDSHRSAMLARASEAFRSLSCGAYAGLAARPEGSSEVLVAIPATGGAKLATDLSKGTRFQLYLALRIAGYHELAKSRPPVPFIADDIMETFDDARAEQAFGLLQEMSRTGQVIYLTHHRHLCDIARSVCPEARVIDLGRA